MASDEGPVDTELSCLDELDAHAFVEDAVPPQRRTTVAAHLVKCKACSELVAGILDAGKLGEEVPQTFGTYKLGALIAQGGMGRIYRAFDTTLSRDVALKVPRSGSPALVKRFEREAAITARLQHPGIVPIHAAGHNPGGTPFYVMRLVDGRTLDRLVDDTPELERRLALVKHVIAIAETMAYVHAKKIVHRDLKPNNVLIGEFGETLIIDWGLAKQLSSDRASLPIIGLGSSVDGPKNRESMRTKAGDVIGTPAFMPPEQALGEPVDERSDVYALGAILRYVLAGRLVTPLEEPPGPPALVAISKRAIATRPEDRYANAGELVAALRVAAAPPRRRWPWLVAAVAVVAIGVIGWRLLANSGASRGERVTLTRMPTDMLRPSLSPSAKRVAYGSRDRLEVRDIDTGQQWTHPTWLGWPFTIEFPSEDEVRFAEQSGGKARVVRWNLTTDKIEQVGSELERHWLGSYEGGSIWMRDDASRALEVDARGGTIALTSASQRALRLFATSPDHHRVAFIEHAATGDAIRVVVGLDERSFTARVDDIAALCWLDADTLLYAKGTLDGSTLMRVDVTELGLGIPEPIYETGPGGWLGTLAARNGRIVGSWIASSFESRLHERTTHTDRQLDKVAASAPLGWRDVVSYWVFNSATRRVERHSRQMSELPTLAHAMLPGDPANATLAGDLLIVTLRAGDGREVIAIDPMSRMPKWTAPKGELAFVRCAGDRGPPCIAGKRSPSGNVAVVRIDPMTGVLGEELVPEGEIADAAIDATGTTIAWVVRNLRIHQKALDGSSSHQVLEPPRPGIHSIAFDPTGGILASTSAGDGRVVGRFVDGKIDVVSNAGRTIVSLVRPSPDGTQVLYRARTLSAELVDIRP